MDFSREGVRNLSGHCDPPSDRQRCRCLKIAQIPGDMAVGWQDFNEQRFLQTDQHFFTIYFVDTRLPRLIRIRIEIEVIRPMDAPFDFQRSA
jgi:hypothetical protein